MSKFIIIVRCRRKNPQVYIYLILHTDPVAEGEKVIRDLISDLQNMQQTFDATGKRLDFISKPE